MGVDVVVSLLTEGEEFELDLLPEADACMVNQMEFLAFPIVDRHVPTLNAETAAFIQTLSNRYTTGKTMVIHCRLGVGRSALMAASVLAMTGMPEATAFARIEQVRGCQVPDTPEQQMWVRLFADTYIRQSAAHEEFANVTESEGLWEALFDTTQRASEHDSDWSQQGYQATLEPLLTRKLLAEAEKQGVDLETLINRWLSEKLQESN
jgi:protein-tyrosine phosphatase